MSKPETAWATFHEDGGMIVSTIRPRRIEAINELIKLWDGRTWGEIKRIAGIYCAKVEVRKLVK